MQPKPLDQFLSVRDAAAEIGIEYFALHQRIYRGTVEVHRPGNRIILIHRDEVERLKIERGASC